MLKFVQNMIANFIISKRYTRVAIVLYSKRPLMIYDFRRRQDRKSVYKAISTIRYPRGKTNTGRALRYMLRQVFRGARSRRVLIVLTDGKSKDSVSHAATKLMKRNVQIIAVGVGRHYDKKTLFLMARSWRNVFTSSFRLLSRLVRAIKQKACRRKCFEFILTEYLTIIL